MLQPACVMSDEVKYLQRKKLLGFLAYILGQAGEKLDLSFIAQV